MKLPDQGTLVGRRLGRYQLDALLGAGGMAEVYRAHDVIRRTNRRTAKPVAVKVLPESLAQDADYVRRFRDEVQRVKKLDRRSNIVPVVDYGEDHGLLYLVMPLYKESLRDRMLRRGKPPISVAVKIARQVAAALSSAHSRDVIHRDVKPENILLDESGSAFLTDFGIARDLTPRQGGTLYTLSASGLPVGTPEYMPPEQLLAQHIDQRADVYALGAVLYELLTGTVPFASDNPYTVAALVMDGRLRAPSTLNPDVPPALDEAVVWALQRKPDDRFPTMPLFDKALEQATLYPDLPLALGEVGNFRLTSRLADSGDRVLAAEERSPGGLSHAGSDRRTGTAALFSTSGFPAVQDANGVTWVPLASGALGLPARGLIGAQRVRLAVWSGIVALLLLSVCGGGSLVAANRLGLSFPLGGDPIAATTTVGAGPTVTVAVLPTATEALPTVTATPPKPTATPVPQLSVSQLQLAKTTSNHQTVCRGPQYITNNSRRTLSWNWQNATLPGIEGFRWGFTSPPQNTSWPPSGAIAAGQPVTLYVQMSCTGQSYQVQMTDSLGRTYTFTMQSQ